MSAVTPLRREAHAPGAETQLAVPPHSIEAESSVLGALLLDNTSFDLIDLKASDFYRYEHRLVYEAVHAQITQGREADVITVFERLQALGKEEEAGGLAYLNSLAQYVPSAGNCRRYAAIVREKSIQRQLQAAGDRIATLPRNPDFATLSIDEQLDEAERQVMAIREGQGGQDEDVKDVNTLMARLLDRVQLAAENPGSTMGVSSGLDDLDRMTNGFQPGDLVVIAARPSMGKTALAINIAEAAAFGAEKLPVLVVSLEMGADQLMDRLVGQVCRIDQSRLKKGDLSESEWVRLSEAGDKIAGVMDIADGAGFCQVSSIRSQARKFRRKHGKVGLIVVDYLQMMSEKGGGSDENRATEVGAISRGLKMLAKEMNCPVIALSQLNRNVEQRTDKRPMMSDIRESGAIEQDADVIMFVYRDDYYHADSKEPGVAELIIGKQRNGPTGTVRAAWNPSITKFDNLAYGS